jgi:hypothetical protein
VMACLRCACLLALQPLVVAVLAVPGSQLHQLLVNMVFISCLWRSDIRELKHVVYLMLPKYIELGKLFSVACVLAVVGASCASVRSSRGWPTCRSRCVQSSSA